MANNRKQIFSFTADADLIDTAKAVAISIDQNFSKFVCNALNEKIKKEIGAQSLEEKIQK